MLRMIMLLMAALITAAAETKEGIEVVPFFVDNTWHPLARQDDIYLQVSLRTEREDVIAFEVRVEYKSCGEQRAAVEYTPRYPNDQHPNLVWSNVFFKTRCIPRDITVDVTPVLRRVRFRL